LALLAAGKDICTTHIATHILHSWPQTPKFQDSKFLHWKTYHQTSQFKIRSLCFLISIPPQFRVGPWTTDCMASASKPATTRAQWRMMDDMWMGDAFPCPITNHNGYVRKPSTSIYLARSQQVLYLVTYLCNKGCVTMWPCHLH
jgi:hypothetical protein